jgi:hypothetical protein
MVDVYSKMKPDALRLQLQTVLTAYYKDIKGVVSARGCTKPKVVKHKLEDQHEAYANTDNANADAATPATSLDGGAAPVPGAERPAPSPGGKGGKAARGAGGGKKVAGKA